MAAPAVLQGAATGKRPNIMIILGDDLGCWDMWNVTAASPKSTFTEVGRYLRKLPKSYVKMVAGTPGTRHFLFASMQWSQPVGWGNSIGLPAISL
jgi:hypothetical protein